MLMKMIKKEHVINCADIVSAIKVYKVEISEEKHLK